MMIFVTDEIIFSLSSAAYPVSVSVKDAYSFTTPADYQISVLEIPGAGRNLTANQFGKTPRFREYSFTIEIYAKAAVIEDNPVTNKNVAMRILAVVDEVMSSEFGLSMFGNASFAPYADSSFFRVVARYSGAIDQKTGYIYRS